jgi:ABC-type multidrug transport system ATPase subunit
VKDSKAISKSQSEEPMVKKPSNNKNVLVDRVILNGISGVFKPGQISAILGASGAGKTSLLNLLCKRITPTSTVRVEGSILANGQPYSPETFSSFAAYVMQKDILLESMTVRECLRFAANLKIQGTDKEKESRVKDILELLKLEEC